MQVINLKREYENLKMEESETVKEYADRLMAVVNKIRLLGEELSDARVVEKVLVSLPEKFESKISSLEDSKDLSQISLSELVNALQAQEQRRAIRNKEATIGAFQAKHKEKGNSSGKGRRNAGERKDLQKKEGENSKEGGKKKFPPCSHCKKTTHLERYCWYRPDIKYNACKQMGHLEKVCRNKGR